MSFTVAAGDDIECTFTNTKGATVTYTKVTDPAEDAQDFAFDATGSGLTDDTLDTDPGSPLVSNTHTDTLTADDLGEKSITETQPDGWTLTDVTCTGTTQTDITDGVSFTVAAGDDIECTFTNVKDATVKITKVTNPASDPEDFGFTNSGTGLDTTATLDTDPTSAGTLSSVTYTLDSSELAGTKTIQENAKTGWTLTTVDCTGVTETAISRGASFTVAAGAQIECTFTNVKDATVKITKVTNPASDPEDFGFTNSGTGLDTTATLDTDPTSAGTLSSVTYTLDSSELAGTKTIQENAKTGWTLTTVDCTGVTETAISRGASFTVAAGAQIECTFTNVKDATVKITKVTNPASDPEDFGFTNSGTGLDTTATLDTDPTSAGTLSSVTYTLDSSELAGTKTIQENAKTGWTLTTVDCTGVTETAISRGASFTVAAGAQIECTFTNVKDTRTGQITPTQTTCQQFNSGTAATLDELQYTVKSGKIGTVAPGVLFYWIKVPVVAGVNNFTITQETLQTNHTTDHTFNTYFGLANGSFMYTANCVKVNAATIGQSGPSTNISFTATASQAGTYIIGIKYDPGTIKGATPPSPPTVAYKFSAGVAGSEQFLNLVKKA